MELLEALEAMLAQNSCICHAAGMPAVEPAFQIELFQIRVISTNRQLKFIRGRRKIKHSDAGEIGAPLWWFSALPGARLKFPRCRKLGCSSQVPFPCLGLCLLQLSISRCSPKPLWAPQSPLSSPSSALPAAGRTGLEIGAEGQNQEFSIVSQCSARPLLIPLWLFRVFCWGTNELKCCGNLIICFLIKCHSFKSTPVARQHFGNSRGCVVITGFI